MYYDALAQSQTGWHEGTEDIVPFIKYLLGTILAAYKDFEDRVALVEPKLPALEMVRRASKNKIGRFNKQTIRELCPMLSDSSIEGALRKLVAAGELKKKAKGKHLLLQVELVPPHRNCFSFIVYCGVVGEVGVSDFTQRDRKTSLIAP